MRIVTRPAPCAMVARFMARRSALVGRSRIHSANARMMMEATITPMDPQKHGMKSGFAWSVQNQAISARINARPAARAASLWNTRASVRMGCVTSDNARILAHFRIPALT